MKDREDGERKMINSNYMAFIYFPKNFTSELTKYIDYRKDIDNESEIYAYLSKESKYDLIFTELINFYNNCKMYYSRFLV